MVTRRCTQVETATRKAEEAEVEFAQLVEELTIVMVEPIEMRSNFNKQLLQIQAQHRGRFKWIITAEKFSAFTAGNDYLYKREKQISNAQDAHLILKSPSHITAEKFSAFTAGNDYLHKREKQISNAQDAHLILKSPSQKMKDQVERTAIHVQRILFQSLLKSPSQKMKDQVESTAIYVKVLQQKNIISKFWKPTDPNPKTPLNIVPSPFQLPHSSRPNKRAVLCGVTYNKRKYRLKGTINDVKNIRDMLITKFGFLGILVLTGIFPSTSTNQLYIVYVSLLLHRIHHTGKPCSNN
ncbi:hypothetical protein JRO89_XS02G0160400 [Xanthoceras sorbifolium]|uniref:Uncharacterized protein n=1 Tax=Xanthoceras sorbifolium TaxID=99658 RepID=A0ABQ8IFZ8_9ROSI|nr:hypothetical protein JRO89_XS02G0160400 [Xanthoceras sorbifolium]